jgi:hypothetical protein
MIQMSLTKRLQLHSTTRYLPLFLNAPPVSVLIAVAYGRLSMGALKPASNVRVKTSQ